MRSVSVVIGLVVFFWLFQEAVHLGAIWESRAHPTPGVTVRLQDGQRLTGALHRDWDASYVIALADGREVHFDRFVVMQTQALSADVSVLVSHWRTLLPAASVITIGLAWLMSRTLATATSRPGRGREGRQA